MLIFIDRPALALTRFINESREEDTRRYYLLPTGQVDAPDAIVVVRNGLVLESLANQRVDAAIGWDTAQPGFAPETDLGRKRTKITIYRTVDSRRRCPSLTDILSTR